MVVLRIIKWFWLFKAVRRAFRCTDFFASRRTYLVRWDYTKLGISSLRTFVLNFSCAFVLSCAITESLNCDSWFQNIPSPRAENIFLSCWYEIWLMSDLWTTLFLWFSAVSTLLSSGINGRVFDYIDYTMPGEVLLPLSCTYDHTYDKCMDQPVKVADPARGRWTWKINISLSAFAPENLVLRDGSDSPVLRQPAHLHTQTKSDAYLRDSSRVPRGRPFPYL